MGKDLKGKELGAGLSQRKDGSYQGRFKNRFGKYEYKYNRNLTDLRKELALAIADNQNFLSVRDNITLDSCSAVGLIFIKRRVYALILLGNILIYIIKIYLHT
jgi:hypothetical protein